MRPGRGRGREAERGRRGGGAPDGGRGRAQAEKQARYRPVKRTASKGNCIGAGGSGEASRGLNTSAPSRPDTLAPLLPQP